MNAPVFHRVLGRLKSQSLTHSETTILAGVSGGADSMALLGLLLQSQRVLGFELEVAHFFHGEDESKPEQTDYRYRVRDLVQNFCHENGLRFLTNEQSDSRLQSEAEFRAARYGFFAACVENLGEDSSRKIVLALGHHQQDAIETQLIQLIRGAGAASFGGFSLEYNELGNESFSYPILRPLIMEDQNDLRAFLQAENIAYADDPSNRKDEYLRNWIRNEWLPLLEEKRSGSLKSLSRSFVNLAETLSDTSRQDPFRAIVPEKIHRSRFNELDSVGKSQLLFKYLRRSGVRGLQRSHIDEVIKRLDSEQNRLSFNVAGCQWETDKDWIKVSALDVPYN